MDTAKQFKNPKVIRDYWKDRKREERERAAKKLGKKKAFKKCGLGKLSRKRTLAAVLVALFCLSIVAGIINIPFLTIPEAHAQITPTTIATSTSGDPVGLSNGVFSAHSVTTSNGWTFAVFSDGTNAELYITSRSGAPSFSLAQSLGAATEGNEIALACNGTTIYYARGSGSATYASNGET